MSHDGPPTDRPPASDRPPTSEHAGCLHHVELYASDYQASAEFWHWLLVEHLDHEPYQEFEGGRSWKRGPTYLVVVRTPEEYRDEPYHRRHPGLNHLAFHADSRAHVAEITAALRERDVPILYEDDHPHAGGEEQYAVYFESPERVKVEVVAPE